MDFNTFWTIFSSVPTHDVLAKDSWIDILRGLLRVLIPMFFVLLTVPPLIWVERRLLGFMQQRQGPNRVGPGGIIQPLADALKLLMKEDIIPNNVDRLLYILAPIVCLVPAMVTAGVLPWHPSLIWGVGAPNVDIGVLYLLAWGSLAVYGIVMAGWSSNNKYALLGGLRSSAQMISYELGMGIAVVTVGLMSGAINTQQIVFDQSAYGWVLDTAKSTAAHPVYTWAIVNKPWLGIFNPWHIGQLFPMGFVAAVIYMIAGLAETNRAPFDLPEAETELIAGYHIEYTSMKFAMFFMGEYANMVVVSLIATTLFFGGWSTPFSFIDAYIPLTIGGFPIGGLIPILTMTIKTWIGMYVFIWLRATLPRLRYDMLMAFGWKGVLPIALGNIFCVAISFTYGYPVALITWVVLAALSIVIVASQKSTKIFTEKTRRSADLKSFATAQTFRVAPQPAAAGGSVRPVVAATEVNGRPSAEEIVK
ncbi:MAG TPA: complex I subunit 1 family protein [Capsulimonadaceae bacterium]|jgi:NADH-quinone oxidoreductase subunit H